jgi:hypothetical protein
MEKTGKSQAASTPAYDQNIRCFNWQRSVPS